MDSSTVAFTWRGVTFGPLPFKLSAGGFVGWFDLPSITRESQGATGHGLIPAPGAVGGRVVTLRGFTTARSFSERDALLAQFRAAFQPNSSEDASTEPLVGAVGGETATVDAQLSDFVVPSEAWSGTLFRWSAQWICPDPRKYSDWISQTVALTVTTTDTALPRALPFSIAARPLGGRVAMFNPGTDAEGSPARFTLVGGQSGSVGVQVIRPSGRVVTVTYQLTLAADRGDGLPDTLVIDTARGGAYLNGEYRPPAPGPDVVADLRLPPGTSVVQALGTSGSGSPSMTVEVRPAKW